MNGMDHNLLVCLELTMLLEIQIVELCGLDTSLLYLGVYASLCP